MPDKSPAHHGRGGTVGGGGNCAADTEVSKQSNVGRDETMVGSSKVVVGHSNIMRNRLLNLSRYSHKIRTSRGLANNANNCDITA